MPPAGFDPDQPSTARMYDYWLGGHDNYQADRKLADAIEELCPQARVMARANREFLARAVTWAAWQGISQFADLGSGFPVAAEHRQAEGYGITRTDADTHVTAREVNPAARVAYVDCDPEVTRHAGALLPHSGVRGVAAVRADLRDPEAVLAGPGLREVIDPAEPVCVLLGLVLHYMDAAAAREVVAGYAQRLAPGGCIVITVPRFDDPQLFDQVRSAYTPAVLHNHTREDVASFLAGLDLVRPGVKPAAGLRPGWGDALEVPGAAYVLGGIGRKPADRLRRRSGYRRKAPGVRTARPARLRRTAGALSRKTRRFLRQITRICASWLRTRDGHEPASGRLSACTGAASRASAL